MVFLDSSEVLDTFSYYNLKNGLKVDGNIYLGVLDGRRGSHGVTVGP